MALNQDYYWRKRPRWGMVNLCSGAIDGLIAITPAAGYVGARE
jgi:ammonia channel protein AmtB